MPRPTSDASFQIVKNAFCSSDCEQKKQLSVGVPHDWGAGEGHRQGLKCLLSLGPGQAVLLSSCLKREMLGIKNSGQIFDNNPKRHRPLVWLLAGGYSSFSRGLSNPLPMQYPSCTVPVLCLDQAQMADLGIHNQPSFLECL